MIQFLMSLATEALEEIGFRPRPPSRESPVCGGEFAPFLETFLADWVEANQEEKAPSTLGSPKFSPTAAVPETWTEGEKERAKISSEEERAPKQDNQKQILPEPVQAVQPPAPPKQKEKGVGVGVEQGKKKTFSLEVKMPGSGVKPEEGAVRMGKDFLPPAAEAGPARIAGVKPGETAPVLAKEGESRLSAEPDRPKTPLPDFQPAPRDEGLPDQNKTEPKSGPPVWELGSGPPVWELGSAPPSQAPGEKHKAEENPLKRRPGPPKKAADQKQAESTARSCTPWEKAVAAGKPREINLAKQPGGISPIPNGKKIPPQPTPSPVLSGPEINVETEIEEISAPEGAHLIERKEGERFFGEQKTAPKARVLEFSLQGKAPEQKAAPAPAPAERPRENFPLQKELEPTQNGKRVSIPSERDPAAFGKTEEPRKVLAEKPALPLEKREETGTKSETLGSTQDLKKNRTEAGLLTRGNNPPQALAPEGDLVFQPKNPQEIFPKLVQRIQTLVREERSEVRLQLKPEHLGQLKIKLSLEKGLLSAEFVVENEAVRKILAANLPQLQTALQEQGAHISQMTVDIGLGGRDLPQEAAQARSGLDPSPKPGTAGPALTKTTLKSTRLTKSPWNQVDLRA